MDLAGDLLGSKGKVAGAAKAAGAAGAAGKASMGSRLASMGKFAKIGGAALAVGAGAYTAYSGFKEAGQVEEQENQAIDEKLAKGEITKEEAAVAKQEVEKKAIS